LIIDKPQQNWYNGGWELTVIAGQNIAKAVALYYEGREYILAVTTGEEFKCFTSVIHFADTSWVAGTNVFTIATGVDTDSGPGGYAAFAILYGFVSVGGNRKCYKSIDLGRNWSEVV
jgi:hypothetical protein